MDFDDVVLISGFHCVTFCSYFQYTDALSNFSTLAEEQANHEYEEASVLRNVQNIILRLAEPPQVHLRKGKPVSYTHLTLPTILLV